MALFLTTPQFAKRVGVTKNTIINWESQGLISPHHVSPTGRRFYTLEQVDEVLSGKLSKQTKPPEASAGVVSKDKPPDG